MTEQQKDFVQMYLKHRDKFIAHNLAYGNNSNYDSVESSANRLLRIPEIAETIRSIQDNIRHEVEEEFKAKYREELLTIYDKRLLLKKIATGEMYVEQKYKGKNCTQCSQYISPTINQMLAAIREDCKLAGHYPHKQNGKWVIPSLQTEQARETEELSPAGGGVSLSADGGGTFALDKSDEKENKGQQVSLTQDQEISPLQGVPIAIGIGVDSRNSNPPENDNKRQQTEVLSPAGGGGFFEAGGGLLAQDNPEKDPSDRVIPARTTVQSGRRAGNKGQHPDSYRENEPTIDNQPLTENNTGSISLPPSERFIRAGFRGIGVELPQEETPENDNKRQQLSEAISMRQIEITSITNKTEVLSPAGGGGFEEAGGGLLAQDTRENDNNLAERLNETIEKDINKRIKRQHPEETNIDNQPFTEELKTHDTPMVNTAGNIISQENLRELLYPKKPILSYMKNNP